MKISVLLPTKDRPDRLARALDAMLTQDGADFEVIIDNGGAPIAPVADERVTILERPAGLEGAAVLNRIADHATGDLFHFAADDDIIQPGTFAQAASIDAEWTYAAVRFHQDGKPGTQHGPIAWAAERMRACNIAPCPTVFWTRRIWDELGPFDETLDYVFDYELWGRFGAHHEPQLRDHVDSFYEIWAGSTTAQRGPEIDAEVRALHDRWARVGFGNREGGR